ncbi:hypothetical protein L4C38_07535 [Vibrio kasasachensis]|uniref:hypothetical protein n=1 Tax=Vibrio kasasachensis TaxID=2910248 RepID=UPI003D0BEA68
MSKIKIAFLTLILIASAVAAWVFIPTHTSLGHQIASKPVGKNLTLVGYKIASTEKKLNKLNQYYLIENGSEIGDQEPLITTSDQFLRIKSVKDNTFTLTVKGRIEQYRNDIWVEKSDGTVEHWLVSLDSSYVR